MAVDFLSLPAEVIHSIFGKVQPTDLARLKKCCRTFNNFIKSDWLIFRDVFLHHFDDPRSLGYGRDDIGEPSWEVDLYNYVRAGKILESKDSEVKRTEKAFVAEAIESLVRRSASDYATSQNIKFLSERFEKQKSQNQDLIVCSSSLFKWAEADLWREGSNITSTPTEAIVTAHAQKDELDHILPETDKDGDATLQPPNTRRSPRNHQHAVVSSEDEIRVQKLCAKIHCLYGVPAREVHRSSSQAAGRYSLRSDTLNDTAPLHPYVRSRVYDLRQHTIDSNGSFWGPFLPDGSQQVDWEKVEAIMCMLHINMSSFKGTHDLFSEDSVPDWTVPFKGATPGSYRSRPMSIPMQPSVPLEAQDPYNVSGTWMRVVCFLDYTELYDFNFGPDSFGPSSHRPRRPLDAEEATRLITMRIQITDIKPPGPDDGSALPVVHFKGTSSSVRPSWEADAHAQIREQGFVRLTPHGEVRWTTWSIFHGEERWRSEGIQVGGVQSGRGVFGFWFDKDYDHHGPAGPTAFWKSHDGIAKPRSATERNDGLHALHVPMY